MFKSIFFSLISCLLFFFCAGIKPPVGGTAKKQVFYIQSVYPAPNSNNHSPKLNIQIQFSEWIQNNALEQNIILIPTLAQKLKINVKGNLLFITSNAKLENNTTYTIYLQKNITSISNQKLVKPFSYSFSTGTPQSTSSIKGNIFIDNNQYKNVYLGLYPNTPNAQVQNITFSPKFKRKEITPNIFKERPYYTIPVSDSGEVNFDKIKKQNYAIIAFKDNNFNLKPDIIQQEPIGIGKLISNNFNQSIQLKIGKLERLPLEITKAQWLPYGHSPRKDKKSYGEINIQFNQSVVPSKFQIIIKPKNPKSKDIEPIKAIKKNMVSKQQIRFY